MSLQESIEIPSEISITSFEKVSMATNMSENVSEIVCNYEAIHF